MAEKRALVMDSCLFLGKAIGVIRRSGSDFLLWNGGLPPLWSVAEKRRQPAVEEQKIGQKIPPLGLSMAAVFRAFMPQFSAPVVWRRSPGFARRF